MNNIKRWIKNHSIDPALISHVLEKSFNVLPHQWSVMRMNEVNDGLSENLGDRLPEHRVVNGFFRNGKVYPFIDL